MTVMTRDAPTHTDGDGDSIDWRVANQRSSLLLALRLQSLPSSKT